MSDDFEDVYLPDRILRIQFTSSPRTSTTITAVSSGGEQTNQNWRHPLRSFTAPAAVDDDETLEDLKDHWLVMHGPAIAFPFRDPLDFASRRLKKINTAPEITPLDQQFGVGDGLTKRFQLMKTYLRGTRNYVRPIALPVADSVLVAMDSLPPNTAFPDLDGGPYSWDVERLTGFVEFDHAPSVGIVLTAGFLFDVAARFAADDTFDQIAESYQVGGMADLAFLEKRYPCRNGNSG